MEVYHNQKLISFHTNFRIWSNPNQMYCELGYDDLSVAIKTLSHRGLTLFLYLAKNMDIETAKEKKITNGGMFPLSPADVERFTWIKRKKNGKASETYNSAVKELIYNGYLRNNGDESYIFSVAPYPSEVSPTNKGVADASEVSPTIEGVADASEVSPTDERESITEIRYPWEYPIDEEIESAIAKAVDAVWLKAWPDYPEESPNLKKNHWVMRDEVESELIKNGIELCAAVKRSLDSKKKYIWPAEEKCSSRDCPTNENEKPNLVGVADAQKSYYDGLPF